VRSKGPARLDCKFNFHPNVRAYQLPFLLAEAVQGNDHPFMRAAEFIRALHGHYTGQHCVDRSQPLFAIS